MSFFGEAAGDLAAVAANTPDLGHGFTMPEPGGFPCINIGPWGRDYHRGLSGCMRPMRLKLCPRVLLS